MKAILFSLLLLATLSFAACKKDDKATPQSQITNATITLKNTNGTAASGITVYAYDQDTWGVLGDDAQFADGQATSDASGNAEFSNIEYTNSFTSLNNNQNNFRFSAHYTLGGASKKKVSSVTVNKGNHVTLTITLD